MYGFILWTDGQFKAGGRKGDTVCLGIAMAGSEVPTELIGRCGLARHLHLRGGRQPEYRFFYRARRPRLPVIRDGDLFFPRWGNRRGQSRGLPRTGWTWLETVRGGGWRRFGAVPVDIPARYAVDGRGGWYVSRQGIRRLLAPDERGCAVAYVICEPASHYYRVMTGSDRMPVFIGERI
jgi:hypothetical protein